MAESHDEHDDEHRALLAAARAWVEWEAELGGTGFPEIEPPYLEPELPGPSPTPRGDVFSVANVEVDARRSGPVMGAPTSVPPAVRTLEPEEVVRRLDVLATEAASCTACRLHEGRTRSVFSRGSHRAVVAFVGEGPGYHEDQSGQPFVGAAGQLLDKMIAAMGLGADEIYVCNVVKCRPPENRTPQPDEVTACSGFLVAQLDLVRPRVIVALGRSASEGLGCIEAGARGWRGQWTSWNDVPVMSTFHPAYLLRSPEQKRPVWNDLQAVVTKLGRTLPTKA